MPDEDGAKMDIDYELEDMDIDEVLEERDITMDELLQSEGEGPSVYSIDFLQRARENRCGHCGGCLGKDANP